MAYIASDGSVIQKKPWSLGAVQEFFWAIITFFVCFFRGLFHMDDASSKGQYGRPNQGQRFMGNPGRRMGGLRGVSGVAPPPCAPGGG